MPISDLLPNTSGHAKQKPNYADKFYLSVPTGQQKFETNSRDLIFLVIPFKYQRISLG